MEKTKLTLYITGETPRSKKAVGDLESLCERTFDDEVTIEIIDVLERPDLAHYERIMVTPILIKTLPPPVVRIIGDLSDKEKVLLKLGLIKEDLAPS